MKKLISTVLSVFIFIFSLPISFADEGEGPLTDVELDCLKVPTIRKPKAREDGFLFQREDTAKIGLYFLHCTPKHLKQIEELEKKTLTQQKQKDLLNKIILQKDGIISDKDKEIQLLESSKQPLWEQILIYTGIALAAGGLGIGIGVAVSK